MSGSKKKPADTSSLRTNRNAVMSMMCLAIHPEFVKIQRELEKLPSNSTALTLLLQLADPVELKKRGIAVPDGTEFEVTLTDKRPGDTAADAEIEVCVGGTTTVAPFVTVKLPKVCKTITIPNPFD